MLALSAFTALLYFVLLLFITTSPKKLHGKASAECYNELALNERRRKISTVSQPKFQWRVYLENS